MTIDALRTRLEEVDRHILELVAARQEVARAVGELKDREARSVRDFVQEKVVIHRARRIAEGLGLAPAMAEELMQVLIQHSLTLQERRRITAMGEGGGRRALVIGGSGLMGDWFARFLSSQGFAVEIADPAPPKGDFPHRTDWHGSPLDHDIIVVAAQLRTTAAILDELALRRPAGVVFDIGSLKSPLRGPLQRLKAAGVKVTSVHPMFGPSTMLLSGAHVILVDLGVAVANQVAKALFANTMATVISMDLERHDRVVAYILGLSHALNIAFFTALAESGATASDLTRLSSTTFDRQLGVAGRVAEENPHLYFEIQHLNDYGTESLAALGHAVERLHAMVRSGDEAGFVALMERGRAYLAGRKAALA